ncbi:MAG: Ig-like domain-containing protein [Bacteroidales bacterium]|jgi:uncharacterized protein YjdB|nr:Ig-like domain-containing protein [Bacteroidales bacterium]MCI2134592.1 Ig-like domain-containing protein [Bacteroidales bacterium]
MKQHFFAFMAFAMAVLAISGCGKTEPKEPAVPTTIKVTGVTLDRQTIDMTEGETTALTATVAPSNATDKSVTWSSSSTAVATVDSNGKVTAVKAGEATITVTTKDGGKSATCKVTVKAATVAVTGVELDPAELSLVEGTSASIKATVTPENATDKDVSWTSSSADVAAVDGNGKVTVVKAGEATVTVTTKDGGKSATCKVTVTAKPVPVTGVKLDKTELTLKKGESVALKATIEPGKATNKKVSWSSNNASVATVDDEGKVTAVSGGNAAIIVTTEDGGHTATCSVTVLKDVTGVRLDKTSITMRKGETVKLTATVSPDDAGNKKVTWKSGDEKIATVDESGNVRGTGFGTTSVTVTTEDGGIKATCEVKVLLATPEITEATPGADNIKVGWKPVDGATGYEVGYKKSSDGVWNAPVTVSATSHSITGLAAERAYDIRVRATDGKAFSEYSYKRYVVTTEAVNPDYTYDKATNTYTVKTAAGLMKWNEEARKDYKANCVLDADITLSAGSGEGNWTPVGYHINASNYRPFKGRFDGQGHTISNLTVDESEGVAGMFGKNEGTVMNLKLENASVSGISSAGGIAGRNDGSIIDCSFSGIVQGSSYVGGIAGENYKKISGCSFSGTVKQGSTGSTVGGIAGNSYHGEILDSHSHGTVTGNNNVGGIVGSAYTNGGVWSRIVACWSDASVNGNHSVGGIAGSCSGYADVISCYFIGKLVGKSSVGGIVGNVTGALSNNHITSCYSSGEITGDTNVGGIAGYLYKGSVITSCYWDKYSGAAVGSGSGESSSATMVDGSSVKWSTATAGMNAAIKSWNADATHSKRQCEFHYVQTGTSLPTLAAGAPE